MNNISKNGWVADLDTMTCRNINTNIVVDFGEDLNIFFPHIIDIPVDISEKWAQMDNEENEKEKVITEAEDVFINAFIGHDTN